MSQTLSILAAAGHHGGFGLHESMLVGSTVLVVLVVVILGAVARSQIGVVPKGLGAAFEHVFDWIDGMAHDMIGPAGRQYVPLLMSFFLFILFSNWSGLLPLPVLSYQDQHVSAPERKGLGGLDESVSHDLEETAGSPESSEHPKEHQAEHVMFEAPTASYNTTLALALISFFAFNWFGIKKNCFPSTAHHHHHEGDEHAHHHAGFVGGFGNWLMHYVQPTPMLWRTMEGPMRYGLVPLLGILFLCLNIMEEFARIVSLSLRLFGNISGEHQVKMTLMDVMRSFIAQGATGLKAGQLVVGPAWLGVAGMIWGAALFATLLGALAGFVQAMVFTMLSLVYIQHAVADDH